MSAEALDETVLVTGYPGTRARAVCSQLVGTRESCRVRLLVRSTLLADASAWLAGFPEEQRARVDLLEGDAAAIDFGLSGAEVRSLGHEVTHIHHCAQVAHLGVERATAERVNVGGALEAVAIARTCHRLRCLVHHSTVHVSGDRGGIVREDELEAGQSFRNVVEETKARAEKVMRAAMRDVPIAIVRPATISCDSLTGEVDPLDAMYSVVLFVVAATAEWVVPLPVHWDTPLSLAPTDWVARAAVAIGREPSAVGATFHLVERAPMSARAVIDRVAREAHGGAAPVKRSLPSLLGRTLLRAPGFDVLVKSPRAVLDAWTMLTTPAHYDATRADALLVRAGLPPCPPLGAYVDRWVDEMKRHAAAGRPRLVASRPPAGAGEPLA